MIYYISQITGTIYDNYKYWIGNLDLSWLAAFNYNVSRDNKIFDEYIVSQPNNSISNPVSIQLESNSSISKPIPIQLESNPLELSKQEELIDESKLVLVDKEETIILNKKCMDRIIDGLIEISYLYIDPLYNEDEPIEIRLGSGLEGSKKSIIGYRIYNNLVIIRVDGDIIENILMCQYRTEVNLVWKNGYWLIINCE